MSDFRDFIAKSERGGLSLWNFLIIFDNVLIRYRFAFRFFKNEFLCCLSRVNASIFHNAPFLAVQSPNIFGGVEFYSWGMNDVFIIGAILKLKNCFKKWIGTPPFWRIVCGRIGCRNIFLVSFLPSVSNSLLKYKIMVISNLGAIQSLQRFFL